MRFTLATVVAALAGLTAAYTPPKGNPTGNAIIKPGLQEQVEAGKPYVITWQPSTPTTGNVALLLLRGPSENVKYLETIVDSTKNTGTYTWTPSTSLENDVTHYGIQIIVEGTGQYQYSTQFGIKNDKATTPSSSSKSGGYPGGPTSSATSASASSTVSKPSGYPTSAPAGNSTVSSTHPHPSTSKYTSGSAYPTKSTPVTLDTSAAATSAAATSATGIVSRPSAGAGEKVIGNAVGALAGLVVAAAMAL